MTDSNYSMFTAVPETIYALQNGIIMWQKLSPEQLAEEFEGAKFSVSAMVFTPTSGEKWNEAYTLGLVGESVYDKHDLNPSGIAHSALQLYLHGFAMKPSLVDSISIREADASDTDSDVGVVVLNPPPSILIAYIENRVLR